MAKKHSKSAEHYVALNIWPAAIFPAVLAALVGIAFWLHFHFQFDWAKYGVLPRSINGLVGIFTAPLVHSSLEHLINNLIPLFILGWLLRYFYTNLFFRVLAIGWLLNGIWTWSFARPLFHIGASGIVYMLAFFLFLSGILRKNNRLATVSLLMVFLYGGLVWGVFPLKEGISWESHLTGAFAGLVLAIYYKNEITLVQQIDAQNQPIDDDEEENEEETNALFLPGTDVFKGHVTFEKIEPSTAKGYWSSNHS